jgi:hypothetical protein
VRILPRLAVAVALTAGLCGPILVVLLTRVPDVTDVALAPDTPGVEPVAREFSFGPVSSTDREALIELSLGDAEWLATTDELQVPFATFRTSPQLRAAEIHTVDGGCRFELVQGSRIANDRPTTFRRVGTCRLADLSAQLQLWLRVGGTGRAAVWTYRLPQDGRTIDPSALLVADGSSHASRLILRGRRMSLRNTVGPRRGALLAYMWNDASPAWIWRTLAASALLFLGGTLLVSGERDAARAAGVACLAGALACLWAMLMPPLQAADEPDHLLSFGSLMGIDLDAGVQAVARRVHFQRIVFHADEHFRPVDREREHPLAWDTYVHAEDTVRRSPLMSLLWRVATPVLDLRHASAIQTLLRLRLLGACVFACVMGGATLLMLKMGGARASPWSMVGLALIPTLPYFATMVSDWALFTSASVLLATAVLVLWQDGPRASWGGLLLGASFGLLCAVSIAALPLAPLVGALLMTRALMGPPILERRVWSAVIFWAGLSAGLALGYFLTADLYRVGYFRYDATGGSGLELLSTVNRLLARITAHPWLVLVPLAAAGAVEVLFERVRQVATLQLVASRLAIGLAVISAVGLLMVFVTSGFTALPTLPSLGALPSATPERYVRAVLTALPASVRLTNFDPLLFTTFWSGFGWLDTVLPDLCLAALALGCAAAFVGLVTRLTARGDSRRIAWLIAVLAGGFGSAAAYAVAGFYLNRDVHGRYLIALYLPLIVLIWQAVALDRQTGATPRWLRRSRVGLVVAAVALHAFSISFVLTRYL